ncbi:MAG: hypothetical protein KF845_05145 [Cyclobacteriaceae bacterium]|nr:hypothetical protein [Cyclobacteriaceae bacterium]
MKKGFILSILVLFITIAGFAQNRFWVASTPGNWSDPANWSTGSGGAGGASVPIAGNTAIFNNLGSGDCILDISPSLTAITINATFTGIIDLPGNRTLTTTGTNTFAGGTINSGTGATLALDVSGTTTFSGTQFDVPVDGSTAGLNFSGSTFNGTVNITKTDNNNYNGQGGNTFNNTLTVTTLGGGELRFAVTNPDTFSDVILNINGTGSIALARDAAGTQFNGNITVNYNGTGNALFGSNGGTSTLADTRTVSVTCGASGCRNLSLANFTQVGSTPQSLTLSGNPGARLTLGPNSAFNAPLIFTSEGIIFNSSTFNETSVFTQTGSASIGSRGGNTFQAVTFNNDGPGDIHLGNTAADAGDIFHGNAVFNNTGGGRIRIGSSTADNIFHGDLTLNNTSVVDVQSRIQISRNSGASVTINGTTTVNNAGNASDIHISYDAGTLATFNGDVIINNAPTAPGEFFWGNDGDVVMNGDLSISNTTNNNLQFSTGTGSVAFGNGTISIGAGGFDIGQLRFRNFTQTGTGATNLVLTGVSALLQIGPATTFGGNVDLRAPQLLLNGATIQGIANLEKTGATANNSIGGNIFNGVTTITNSGSGQLMFGNGTADQFNASTTFNNTGSYRIVIANNHSGQTTSFANDVTFNTNKTGGDDGWSFLVAEGANTNLSFGGDVTINCAGALQSNHRFLNGGGGTATYNGTVTINATNTHASTSIAMSTNGTSAYHGDIHIVNDGGSAGVTFNANASASSVLNGAVSLGTFSSGSLNLYRFTQVGAFPHNLTLTNTGTTLRVGPNSAFEGDVNFVSPRLFLNGCTYAGTGNFEKTGSSDDAGTGGNIFTGVTTITNSGSGYLMTGSGSRDQFLSETTFNNTGSYYFYFAHNHDGETTEFASDLTLNSNKSGGSNQWSYLVGNHPNTGLLVGGALTINNMGTLRSDYRFLEGAGSHATFDGPVIINSSNSHPSTLIHMGTNGTSTYNGDISISNSGGTAGVTFNTSASASSVLNGSISVGPFSSGSLNLYRFRQVGTVPQTVMLTGTGILRLGPSSEFDGDVTFSSPQLLLNGTTYNGTAYLEKTSVGTDDGTGGNIFNSTATLVNSGDARLRTGSTNPDIFNSTLAIINSGASTIQLAYNSAGNEFNGNIELNSTFGGGIWFGQETNATSTLAAGRTIGVGSSGVISGDIRLMRFTQVGPTAQTLALSGIAILTLGPSSSFDGDIDFKSPQLLLNGVTMNGIALLEKTGAGDNASRGGNIFNGPTSLTHSGSGYFYSAQNEPDIFNDDLTLTNTGSNLISIARSVPGNEFNGDIIFNATLGSTGIYIAAQAGSSATLAAGGSLLTGGLGYSSGFLSLRRFTQLGAEPQTLLLTGTALLQLGPEATFNGDLDFRSPQFELNGTTFNGTTHLEKTGATGNDSNGGNIFNGITTIANSGSNYFRFAVSVLDQFNNDLTLLNTGAGTIRMADNIPGTAFNGNIIVNSTFGGGVYFSERAGGTATLASGRTITVGGSGFTTGDLIIRRFTQLGTTPQTLLLSGNSRLILGTSIIFNGSVDFRAPQVFLQGGTYNNTAHIEKTGATDNTSTGGNTFNSITTIANSGPGQFILAGTNPDTFNAALNATNTGTNWLRFGDNSAGNQFNGSVTFTNTAGNGIIIGNSAGGFAELAAGQTFNIGTFTAGELRFRRVTQVGATPQTITLTGTALLTVGTGTTFNGDVTFVSPQVNLDGGTYNGDAYIEKSGAGTNNNAGGNTFNGTTILTNSSAAQWLLSNTTPDTFNGAVTFSKTSSGALFPAYNLTNIFTSDITIDGNAVITLAAGTGVVEFTGTNPQTIYKTGGTPAPIFRRINLNKPSNTVTLDTDITISTNALFTSGVLHTDAVNYLNFAINATATDASDASYVDGPVRKTGNNAFTFPIGDNGFYRPISMSAPTGTTQAFTAQYFNENHLLGSPAVWDPSFWTVSGCEYWTLDRNVGASNVVVTLSWNEAACNPGYITNPASLRVTRWTGTNWVDEGNGGTTGTATNGTIMTATAVSTFSPFTLASTDALNPLPVELEWFRASITPETSVLLEWRTASELNNEAFEVERSKDGFEFTSIARINGAGTTSQKTDYSMLDEQPLQGLSYYRLKQIDFDGTFTYSILRSVRRGDDPFIVYPNPAGKQWVTFNRKVNAVVINNLNQIVGRYAEAEGFDTSDLAPGLYIVRTHAGETFKLIVR